MRKTSFALVIAACGYPQPANHSPDAGSAAPDAAEMCPAGGCQLLAIEPSIANAGDTIALEGTFSDGAIVNFPGGATAQANVLGPHRATAIVPASATAGDLTVTSGGATVGPLSFRRALFSLGLQTFDPFDDQSTGARQAAALISPRYAPANVVVNGSVYVIGGSASSSLLASVERAGINADGSLGAFSAWGSLTAPRSFIQYGAAEVGGYVYVFGGLGAMGALASVERAAINSDGSLGPFAIAPGVQLVHARYNHAVVVVGNSVVVLGGSSGVAPYFLDSVESAPINPDGSLGAFVEISHLVTAREALAAVVIGSSLYVLGGDATFGGAPALASIESAPIGGDGSLGAFVFASSLATPRGAAHVWRVGGRLFVAGGGGSNGPLDTIESASIAADGSLGGFAASGGTIANGIQGAAPLVVGNFACAIGGSDSNGVRASVACASLDSGGALDVSVTMTGKLARARYGASASTVGGAVYVVGGQDANGPLATVERASVAADGSLGSFAGVSSALQTARIGHAAVAIGDRLYVIGGITSAGYASSVEVAQFMPDGSLGAFAAGPSLATARSFHTAAVIGSYVYVFGGFNGSYLTSVERATIAADGTLGAFGIVPNVGLVMGRNGHTTAILGDHVYVITGATVGEVHTRTVESAPINADGSIGTFAIVNGVTLGMGRIVPTSAVVGNELYVLGGRDEADVPTASIEHATINPDGSLGTLSSAGTMSQARDAQMTVVLGNDMFTLGGTDATSAFLDSIESAGLL